MCGMQCRKGLEEIPMRGRISRWLLVSFLLIAGVGAACGDTMSERVLIAREGNGYLERVGPQLVLHLRGTPAEMGRQHGALLKKEISSLVAVIESRGEKALGPMADSAFDLVWNLQLKHLPSRFVEEMRALAEAAGIPYDKIRRCNTIPEFFHCSGFAVFGEATVDGVMYHGRILDYGVDLALQDHSVVIIAQPEGLEPFVNVTYAGFIGSVTGMNRSGIGFGEIGGKGLGKWDGIPMAFLMRRGLEECKSLDAAKALFEQSKRTCEYYYVISDSNRPDAVGVHATDSAIEFVGPNEAKGPLNVPIKDAVVISEGDRYPVLTQRINADWGRLDAAKCRELMRRPVSMKNCLHTVLMAPGLNRLWVAHATSDGRPASEQSYVFLNIAELIAGEPREQDKPAQQ